MTKTINIDWNGGKKRIEITDPGEKERMVHLANAPTPLEMNPTSLAWMNAAIIMSTDLTWNSVERVKFDVGLRVLSEVLGYWKDLGQAQTSEKVEQVEVDGLELDDQGVVDLEDMR